MASSLDRWFAPFEGARSAYPVAIFRVAFFTGLALHFFPTLLRLDEAYRRGALRSDEWNGWLFAHFWRVPHWALAAGSVVTMAACVMAAAGAFPRAAAIVSGIGFFVFASFNGLHLQTLALVEAWGILLLWMICGGGAAALSVQARLRKKAGPPVEPRLLSALVLYQVLLGVFFSGVEKLLAGWPWTNEMGIVLSYPRGFMVRDWVAASGWLHASFVTHALSWLTLVVELGTPIGLLFRRTRLASLALFELFFLGIIVMLEVPPLFYCTFAFGALLALDDDEVARARAFLRRTPAPAAVVALGLVPMLGCGHPSAGTPPPTGLGACDGYFDAVLGAACGETTRPPEEVARIRARFETICQNELSLPGNGATADAIEACAVALKAAGCGDLDVPECTFQGSLADGTACNESSQCQSGTCKASVPSLDGGADGGADSGGAPAVQCGRCATDVAVGEPCATGDTCVYGSLCAASGVGYACTTVAYGDTGTSCDGLASQCKTGLYCDIPSSQCAAPGGPGAACGGPAGCAAPLTCAQTDAGPGLTCQTPGQAGAPCQANQDCAAGFACATATSQCAAITWVAAGQPCGDVELCLVGACPLTHASDAGLGGPGGTCPLVIPDGALCTPGDPTHTCDTFSVCSGGVCAQPDSVACQ